ncbi:MAG: aminotransferase class V-fold PLP-dependent enzyme, partial [Bacteroidota bacterium]
MLNTKIDIASIRKDFPTLSQKVYGKELVYFDNAATSQKPQVVIDRLNTYYKEE